jgi:hypothetical protein
LISNKPFEELRKKANEVRGIELTVLLQHFGSTKDLQDKTKWHTRQGVISVNGPKFMNWTRGTGGGGAIDLVIHLQGVCFKEAVLWLHHRFSSSFVQRSSPIKSYPVKKRLKLPQKENKKLPQVTQYLINKRYLPEKLIKNLIRSKKLYADIRGNAVFLLLGKKKRVVGAELRGTCNLKWRGMAPGSRKYLGCFYIVGKNARKMALCESAIDAASFAVLYPEYTAISTSGVTDDRAWIQNFITNDCKIYCGFDADEIGDTMANKMIKRYPSIKRLRPSKHDWNEVLQSNSL